MQPPSHFYLYKQTSTRIYSSPLIYWKAVPKLSFSPWGQWNYFDFLLKHAFIYVCFYSVGDTVLQRRKAPNSKLKPLSAFACHILVNSFCFPNIWMSYLKTFYILAVFCLLAFGLSWFSAYSVSNLACTGFYSLRIACQSYVTVVKLKYVPQKPIKWAELVTAARLLCKTYLGNQCSKILFYSLPLNMWGWYCLFGLRQYT